MRTLEQHLDPEVMPKRILALDGGGIRGLISLGILEHLEQQFGAPLSDHFDLIGGTSTGALIATKLALGSSVEEIVSLYETIGANVFKRTLFPPRLGVLRAKFSARPLIDALQEEVGHLRLGDAEVKTGLAVVCKRLDTGSPWVLHNNPAGKYFDAPDDVDAVANKNYELAMLLRASTAAPSFFDPVKITVAVDGAGKPQTGVFVDGGVSPHNNPSLQLLMLATLSGYKLNWRLGADRLQIVSVGTGTWKPKAKVGGRSGQPVADRFAAGHALRSLLSMMYDASAQNELMLQWLSASPTARVIDSEVGDLSGDLLNPDSPDGAVPTLSYLRYDAPLEERWLHKHLPALALDADQIGHLQKMDRARDLDVLLRIGRAAGEALVQPEHLALGAERSTGPESTADG